MNDHSSNQHIDQRNRIFNVIWRDSLMVEIAQYTGEYLTMRAVCKSSLYQRWIAKQNVVLYYKYNYADPDDRRAIEQLRRKYTRHRDGDYIVIDDINIINIAPTLTHALSRKYGISVKDMIMRYNNIIRKSHEDAGAHYNNMIFIDDITELVDEWLDDHEDVEANFFRYMGFITDNMTLYYLHTRTFRAYTRALEELDSVTIMNTITLIGGYGSEAKDDAMDLVADTTSEVDEFVFDDISNNLISVLKILSHMDLNYVIYRDDETTYETVDQWALINKMKRMLDAGIKTDPWNAHVIRALAKAVPIYDDRGGHDDNDKIIYFDTTEVINYIIDNKHIRRHDALAVIKLILDTHINCVNGTNGTDNTDLTIGAVTNVMYDPHIDVDDITQRYTAKYHT